MNAIIVENHKSTWTIVVDKAAGRVAQFAARELRDFLERMARCSLPIAHEPRSERRLAIVEDGTLPEQGFRLEVTGKAVNISGNGSGVLYGVYRFLEKLGCRFVVPGDDCVPFLPTAEVEQQTIEEAPDYSRNSISSSEDP